MQRQFWRLIAEGVQTDSACERLDLGTSTGRRWFSDAGGMTPLSLLEPTGRFLTLFER